MDPLCLGMCEWTGFPGWPNEKRRLSLVPPRPVAEGPLVNPVFQPLSFCNSNNREVFHYDILGEILLATSYTVSMYVGKLVLRV